MNIVLIGVECAGKTTVAKAIAEMSDYQYIDTDEFTRKGLNLDGHSWFSWTEAFYLAQNRNMEEIAKLDHHVIATGALVPGKPGNVEKLRKNGVIFRLDASVDTVIERMKHRPHWVLEGMDEFYIVRENYETDYKACQDYDFSIPVSNEQEPEEYAKEILAIMEAYVTLDEPLPS